MNVSKRHVGFGGWWRMAQSFARRIKRSLLEGEWRRALRQSAKFPKEFRIAPLAWRGDMTAVIEKLKRMIAALTIPERPPDSDPWQDKEITRLVSEIGTNLWRMRQKMVNADTDRQLETMRRPFRHLESIWDALSEKQITIQDHTGKPYDPGQLIKVLAYETVPGIGRDTVIETITPTIYLKSEIIQMGEVIVGTPQESRTDAEAR